MAHVEPKMVNFSTFWSFVSHLGHVRPSWPYVGAKLGQVGAKLGQVEAKLGHAGAKLGEVGNKLGQVGDKLG
eukprot:12401068-Karenia_brevis.AAC.1